MSVPRCNYALVIGQKACVEALVLLFLFLPNFRRLILDFVEERRELGIDLSVFVFCARLFQIDGVLVLGLGYPGDGALFLYKLSEIELDSGGDSRGEEDGGLFLPLFHLNVNT